MSVVQAGDFLGKHAAENGFRVMSSREGRMPAGDLLKCLGEHGICGGCEGVDKNALTVNFVESAAGVSAVPVAPLPPESLQPQAPKPAGFSRAQ